MEMLKLTACVILLWSLEACAQKWVEVRETHFIAVSNTGERPARRALGQLTQVRTALSQLGWATDLGKPYVVVLTKDSAAATHEYVHRVEERNVRALPLWLHEGLAEYHSQVPAAIAPRLKGVTLLPLEAVRAVDSSSSLYNEASRSSLFYGQSWALVHYLYTADSVRFTRYLQLLRGGAVEVEAWSQVFGDGKALEAAYSAYIQKAQFTTPPFLARVTEVAGPAREVPAPSAEPQEPEAHAAMAEALLKQPSRLEEALAEARKAAEMWPGLHENQLRIGRVLLAMNRNAEAAAVARRVASEARSATQQAAAVQLAEQVRQNDRAQTDQQRSTEVARLAKQRDLLREELAKKKRQPRRPLPAAFGLAEGVIGPTGCRLPWILEMEVKGAKDAVKLQAIDFRSVDFSASGWNPPADFNACRDLQGRQARVYYLPVTGASYAGEILIVEVIKPPAPPPKKVPPKKKR